LLVKKVKESYLSSLKKVWFLITSVIATKFLLVKIIKE